MEFNNLHQFGVVYEMNLDSVWHERKVYGFLDWLSDIGGLVSALMAGFAIILRICMYQALDFHMVERLFTREQLEQEVHDLGGGSKLSMSKIVVGDQILEENSKYTKLDLGKVSVIKSNAVRFMPPKIQCRRCLRDEEKLFIKGLEHYYKRINLGNFFGTVEKLRRDVSAIKARLEPGNDREQQLTPVYSPDSP